VPWKEAHYFKLFMITGMNMLTRGIDTVAWCTWPCPGPEPQGVGCNLLSSSSNLLVNFLCPHMTFILLVRMKFNKQVIKNKRVSCGIV
jgi:hypothetical protein